MEAQKLCSVVMCKNHVESTTSVSPIMFEFPPRSDPRYEKWCSEIERNDLLNKEAETQTHYVCIDHFEPKMYYFEDKLRLYEWAMPAKESLTSLMPTMMNKEIVPSSLNNVTDVNIIIFFNFIKRGRIFFFLFFSK